MEKQIVSRDQEVIFHNWTDQDHLGVWIEGPTKNEPVRRRVWELKAKKSYYVPFYAAEKFAREIADREYWTAFNSKLESMRMEKGNDRLDRRQLESLVQNSNDIRKLSKQELMDKCIEIMEPDNLEMVRPKEVKIKEVLLKRDERAKMLRDKYPGLETPMVNEKAIRESEQFE